MIFSEVLKLYQNGYWSACFDVFNEYSSETSKLKPKVELDSMLDEIIKNFLCENNALVCEILKEQTRRNLNWSDCMDRFIQLYSRYRSVSLPLDLELNVVYNIQWWFSIQSEILRYESLYFRKICDVISKVLFKVLKSYGDVALDQEPCYDISGFVNKLRRGSDVLLLLPPVTCMQLLDVIMLAIFTLLKHRNDESYPGCTHLIKNCLCQFDLLKLHVQQKVVSGNEEIYFKFGFKSVNSTASLSTCSERLDVFVIIGSLVCAVNKAYELCIDYLKKCFDVKTNPFQFLISYIQAHCHYHLKEYNEAKLCLAYSTSSPPFARYEGYYRLLLARVLSAQDENQAALVHCEAVLSCQPGLSALAAHLATTIAKKLSMSTAQLLYLNKLVQSLKSPKEDVQFEGFEACCLTILCDQYSVTLHEALYLLARQMYLSGYHDKALASYSELTELLKSDSVDYGMKKLLPEKIQIVHETALANIKANNLKGGEHLCRQSIRAYIPARPKGSEDTCFWESILYSLEDDVVSMTLLADILAHSDKRKALDELNRCYNALSESQEQATVHSKSEHVKELCDWFMSRILMRKARVSDVEDAAHYFRRALIQRPGDKEVVFYYKQWALCNPDHESFDPGDQVVEFPVNQLHSLAVSHILGSSVTDEEWMALCANDSSQNVLESLFDDDD